MTKKPNSCLSERSTTGSIVCFPQTDMKGGIHFYTTVFENSPLGMAIYDGTGQCVEANNALCTMIGGNREQVLAQNYNHVDSWKNSGLLALATKAAASRLSTRQKITLTSTFGREFTANVYFEPLSIDGGNYLLCTFDDLTEMQRLEDEREKLINELRETIDEVNTLKEVMSLCCFCKKIRDDEGYWEQLDVYIHKHKLADISHSICPACAQKHYPGVNGRFGKGRDSE